MWRVGSLRGRVLRLREFTVASVSGLTAASHTETYPIFFFPNQNYNPKSPSNYWVFTQRGSRAGP